MVIPGIFELTPENALRELTLMGSLAPKIQLDIADGLLVNGTTFMDLSPLVYLDINAELQLHLMVQKPEAFLIILPPTIQDVCTQAEAFIYKPLAIESYLDVLKAKGLQAGLSFNFQTPFDDFLDFIPKFNYVQMMSVNPGGQGRTFIPEALTKIKTFKEKFPTVHLQVDGGITQEILPSVVEAGADSVVVGSEIFKTANPTQTYKAFVLQFENAHRNLFNRSHSTRFANQNVVPQD